MTSPRLTVVSGPKAVGKGTVVARLRLEHPEIFVSVSATTRPARPGEVDGVHYHFVTEPEFDALIEENALLEWAVVHGTYRYGTEPVRCAKPFQKLGSCFWHRRPGTSWSAD